MSISTYTAIIIEPRKHKAFHFVINNFLDNLSNEWNIIIFHGINNEEFIKNIINNLKETYINRITLINLNVENLTITEYNNTLTNESFYNYIPTETFMIFQTDTLILNKEKLSTFLNYDYVGAPWGHIPVACERVGNGGLSLRKKSKMLEIIRNIKYSGKNEDVYFCYNPNNALYKPSLEEAMHFSVEEMFFDKPFGCHKPWNEIIDPQTTEKFFNLYPQVRELYRLNIE